MSGSAFGFAMFGVMLVLLAVRVPIAAAMFATGMAGYVTLSGLDPFLAFMKTAAFARLSNYELSVIPLFLLMGNLASQGGLSKSLFDAASAFIGHLRGGVAMAAVGACAGFGAICGSSLATAATMGRVALPELRRHHYSPRLATGTLAAGGTLGILIPPSVPLVVYAMLAEQNIAKLFTAAFVPGIIATIGYMIAIAIVVRIWPQSGPAAPSRRWREKLAALRDVWPVATIFLVVIGGIYGGVFTPTEGASIGTVLAAIVAFAKGELDRQGVVRCLLHTAEASAMIFFVLLGADVLNAFLALSQMPQELAGLVKDVGIPPLAVIAAIILIYILLGCVMDSLSMLFLTIPIFFPIVMGLDIWALDATEKAIWFGILALMVVEIGLVHPPVGMNLYIINSLAGDVPMMETFKGVIPFLLSDAVRVTLLILFPVLSLWLVRVLS